MGEWPEEPDQAALPLAEAQEPASGQGWELVDSEVLGELVVFAVDEAAAQRAPAGFVVYTAAELERLDGLTPDGLRCVHKAKKMLAGRVTQVLEVAV